MGENTEVDSMTLENIATENLTGQSMPMLLNEGSIEGLSMRNIQSGTDPLLVGSGVKNYKLN